MNPGDKIYITKVAYPQREQLERHCTQLTVEHTTPKAILVRAGDHTQWFPRSVLQPSSNTRDVYLLPRWFQLTQTWNARCGSRPKRREKNNSPSTESST